MFIHNDVLSRPSKSIRMWPQVLFILVAGLFDISSLPAAGLSAQQCLAAASGLNNPLCVAGDVRIATISLLGAPQLCAAGTQKQVEVEISLLSATDRWDIGIWISQAGGSANSGAGNSCFRDILIPVGTATECNHASDFPVYYNQDGDACGDLYAKGSDPCGTKVVVDCTTGIPSPTGGCILTRKTAALEVACVDSNGDQIVDTGVCASWASNSAVQCDSIMDAVPDTGSKCACSESVAIANLNYWVPPEEVFLDGFEDTGLLKFE